MGCGFTFVHCADLHLGSRFWGMKDKDSATSRNLFESTFRSFSRIVDLAIDQADFMVISGDIYDDLFETPRTRLFFASEMRRFGKPCYIVTGNHDAVHAWSESIPYPPNVTQIGTEPERHRVDLDRFQVEVAGVSFDGPHTDENLVSKIRGTPGMFTIGMVHCSVSSMGASNDYAPCSMNDFLGKDVQYWALGHIHKRMVLRDSEPMVVYPGNIQGRDIAEPGEKGCYLVTVEGGNVTTQFVPTQEVVWKELAADITMKDTVQELVDSLKPQIRPGSIIALNFVGRGKLNHLIRQNPDDIAELISLQTDCPVIVRRVACGPEIDLDRASEGGTLVSGVLRAAGRLSAMSDEELLDRLCSKGPAADIRPYLQYFAKHGQLHDLVDEAKLSAVDRIIGGDGE